MPPRPGSNLARSPTSGRKLLPISTLAGLTLYAITGATWLDPVVGFVIALFAINEGREAREGELDEEH